MSGTQKALLLAMLERNLELILTFMDEESKAEKEEELGHYIDAAVSFIEREGVSLDFDDISDCTLVVMYASWIYEKRRDPSAR